MGEFGEDDVDQVNIGKHRIDMPFMAALKRYKMVISMPLYMQLTGLIGSNPIVLLFDIARIKLLKIYVGKL